MDRHARLARVVRLLLLALPPAIVGVLALALLWSQHLLATGAFAGDPGDVDFSMAVKGGRGKGPPPPSGLSPPEGCTTKISSSDQCGVLVNGVFTVSVFINNYVGLAGSVGAAGGDGYHSVQVRLNYNNGLGIGKGRPGVTELGPDSDPFWPPCEKRSEDLNPKTDTTPSYKATCSDKSQQESFYTGLVMEQDFACSGKGKQTITLKHGTSDTNVLVGSETVVDADGSESITVDCQNPNELFSEGFKCYRVTAAQPKFTRRAVTLLDQIEQRESRLLAPVAFCNTVEKEGLNSHAAGGQAPFFDDTAHLTCYSLEFTRTEPAFRVRDIFVLDQFGARRLTLRRPTRMCEPAEKEGAASDFALRVKCYKVRGAFPLFSSRSVGLVDQFGEKESVVVKPVSYCTLATKTAVDGTVSRPPNDPPYEHLVCYSVEQGPIATTIGMSDQFGSRELTLGRVDSYCTLAVKTRELLIPTDHQ